MPDIKLPPQNIEAEESILGSILIDKEAIFKVIDIINADDFYKPAHEIIFGSLIDLFEQRIPTDLVTLTEELTNKKKLEEIGGADYLNSLVAKVPAAIHVKHYADIVRQKAILRRLITAAKRIAELGFDEESDVDQTLDEAEKIIFDVAKKHLREEFIQLKDVLSETFDRIDELHKNKGTVSGIPTGYRDLDNYLGGMQRSDLIILAARPAMGKTSLGLNIAQNIACRQNLPVGIFSLEMSKQQLTDRLLCAEANVDLSKMRTGYLVEEDFQNIGTAMGILGEASIFIDDTPGINILEMRTKARRLQAENGLSLLVVDYLQLMSGRRSSENRVQEISEITRSLKGLARELDTPIIALSQLSRAVEQRPSKIPMLSDLRESGSIEQDADVVMFIYRDDYYNPDTERSNIADIHIAKHRNGPTGKVELYFRKQQTRFENLSKTS